MDFYVSPVTLLFESSLVSIAPEKVQVQKHTKQVNEKGKEKEKCKPKKLKKDFSTVIEMAESAIRLASKYTDDIEFSCEDAGRTPLEFLYRIIERAIAAGANTINIPDTVGYTIPSEFGAIISSIRNNVPNIDLAIVAGDIVNETTEEIFDWYVQTRNTSYIEEWYEIIGNHDLKTDRGKLFREKLREEVNYSILKDNILFIFKWI